MMFHLKYSKWVSVKYVGNAVNTNIFLNSSGKSSHPVFMVSAAHINKTGYRWRADLIPAFLLVPEERNFPGKSCRKANNFQFDSAGNKN